MSAREELYEYADSAHLGGPGLDWRLDAFRDEVLREAAEKIRKSANATRMQADRYGMRVAADLIDPDKEESADGAQ